MTITQSGPTIIHLDDILAGLSHEDRALFERLFQVTSHIGRLVPPESMYPWIQRQFGSLEAVTDQRVIRVINRFTLDDALFKRAPRVPDRAAVTGG